MNRSVARKIISLVKQAQQLASRIGIPNILQPGLVKEMMIADILNHEVITTKRDADAYAVGNPDIKYEYLSCKEGGSGQLDRMFKSPTSKREESLRRITRNDKIYFAVFFADKMLEAKVIYEIEPKVLLKEAERQLDASSNAISHCGFSENWARTHGRVVYEFKS